MLSLFLKKKKAYEFWLFYILRAYFCPLPPNPSMVSILKSFTCFKNKLLVSWTYYLPFQFCSVFWGGGIVVNFFLTLFYFFLFASDIEEQIIPPKLYQGVPQHAICVLLPSSFSSQFSNFLVISSLNQPFIEVYHLISKYLEFSQLSHCS